MAPGVTAAAADPLDGLLPHHRKMLLEESGIAPEVVVARGYRTLTTPEELHDLGFTQPGLRPPGLLLPGWGPSGENGRYVFRPDDPPRYRNGKPKKYLLPPGSRAFLDVPPACREALRDPRVPLYIVEGQKKADAAASKGLCVVAILGVDMWRGKNTYGAITTLDEWQDVAWAGPDGPRLVGIVFDSDVVDNGRVWRARRKFRGWLQNVKRARVVCPTLPAGPNGEKVGLDDYLLTHTVAELEALATEPEPAGPPPPPVAPAATAAPDRRPRIDAGILDLPVVTALTWEALTAWNAPPTLFRHGGQLSRLRQDDGVRLQTEPLTEDRLRGVLGHAVHWFTRKERSDGPPEPRDALPPVHVVKNLLADPAPPLPPLTRIVAAPVFSARGQLLTAPGYHPGSRTYYAPHAGAAAIPPVPAAPSAGDLGRARHLLLTELLGDFPFTGDAERAHALALLLLPFARDLIAGPTPLHLFEKPAAGTGAGLLVDVLLTPAIGGSPAIMTEAGTEDEWRKRITSSLLQSPAAVLIDNLRSRLDSAALSAALTAPDTWEDRRLGFTENVSLPVRCAWAATGNNPSLSDEIARRVVRCRIDAGVEYPAQRPAGTFAHPDLREWAQRHRHQLVWAALVLVRHWLASGRPYSGRLLGTFEAWSRVIGGVLEAAGVPGFLANLEATQREANAEREQLFALVAAWWDAYGDKDTLVKELLELVDREELPLNLGPGEAPARRIRLGKLLADKLRDRVFGGKRVVRTDKVEHHARLWALVPIGGESGESGGRVGESIDNPLSPTPEAPSNLDEPEETPEIPPVGESGESVSGSTHAGGPARAPAYARGQTTLPTLPDDAPYQEETERGECAPALSPEPLSEACGLCGADVFAYTADGHARCETHTHVVYAASEEALARELPGLLAAPVLGLDAETTGLDPHADRLRLVQLAVEGRTVLVDAFAVDVAALAPLLAGAEGPRLVGHNLGFDLQFLAAAGLPVPDGGRLFDTMLAAQVGDSGEHLHAKGRFTLEALAKRVARIALDKTEQTGAWGQETLTAEQLRYAAADAEVLLPLAERLDANLVKAGLRDVAQLEFDALPAVAWLERTGAPFDAGAWEALAAAAEAELPARREAVVAHARSLGEGWLDVVKPYTEKQLAPTATGKPRTLPARTFNPDSHDQQLRLLRALGVDVADVQEDTLKAVAHVHPVVAALLALKEVAKNATAFGRKYLQHVHPQTGRIHASYAQLGSEAGRMSCRDPNLQQVPKPAAYRAAFRAPAGRVLVKADYAQIELCVAAELSGDARMLEVLHKEGRDGDLHYQTAAALYKKAPEDVTRDERAFAKIVNFGTVFGQGVPGLRDRAAAQGIPLTEAEARAFLAAFDAAWPGLTRWRTGRKRSRETVVRTASGRRRQLAADARGTFRLNTPVQGTAADGFKAALAALWATRQRCPSGVPVLAVHDELVVEADAADAEAAKAWVTEAMVTGMRRYVTKAPVRVEASVSATWGGQD